MKMFSDACNDPSRQELEDRFTAAINLLDQVPVPEKSRRARTLAAILREQTHSDYLRALSPEQLAEWTLTLLDFIESRETDIGVSLLPLVAEYPLLVTNVADVPYLVDSLRACLTGLQHRFHMVCHPIFKVRRQHGVVTELGPAEAGAPRESLIVLEVGVDAPSAVFLIETISQVFAAVLRVDRDRERLARKLEELQPAAGASDAAEFWSWLRAGNFLPFAYRRHRVRRLNNGAVRIDEIRGAASGLFLAAETAETVARRWSRARDLLVEETPAISPVLRAEPLMCVGLRQPLADNRWEEHEFFGLFPEKTLAEPTLQTPALAQRVAAALAALGIAEDTHDYRTTVEIFNTFPKAELFFMDPEELRDAVRSLIRNYRKIAVRVVVADSLAVCGLTLLLVMPRDFYTPEAMARIEAYLARYCDAPRVESRVIHIAADYSSHYLRLTPASDRPRIDLSRLERSLTRLACPWNIRLHDLLDRTFGEAEARRLWFRYAEVFSRNYQLRVHPRFALRDLRCLERVLADGGEVFDLWGPFGGRERHYRLQFYSARRSYLNELMPLLENLNLMVIEEVDFNLSLSDGPLYIKSFSIVPRRRDDDLAALRNLLLEALGALRRGELENDYLNRLLVPTGLSWREIDVFRGYRNYYFQLGSPYSKKRVAFALINNPQVARLLFRYFEGRFCDRPEWGDPLAREDEVLSSLRLVLATALQGVADVNEDNILRILFNLIDSTVRTNFFIRRDRPDYFFSFKISAIGIIDMPAPRPLYEIYVHSATMEGIHLRGGKVARGGLRWSDRPDDFRTEVLGLMKTQMTKNALIVPVGSKGGFVVKTPYAGREEGLALAKEAYKTLVGGLLDLTDNRVGDQVARPPRVIAYDEEDPYLVVAADKGTAHLPDTANALSQAYGFWLDDAFASGGSQGYDHKKLAITARGAWECVKRHFRELGTDIQTRPFTVVGIGDMSGDVFGNGMLQSRCIRLLAAFDHRHVFLDPDPDPETSFAERRRLFNLPRSSWDDYNRALISEGGGVYSRDAKDIPLSPRVRNWLGVRHESLDAPGLIRLLLTAEVDLLWNGGIGTYVKAGVEKHEDAGDRANDGVRIDARQLRAKVVGEGGNLGFTQRGRIEYALNGGRINTDAVDNSAGVDCSDHEVNLKIFMQQLRTRGLVSSTEERNQRLEAVTDDVCRAVLANNYTQSLCLSLDQRRCGRAVEPFIDLADRLAGAGLLDRRGEFLPSAKEVLARESRGFTRPELAILMAYSKMQMFQALMASDLPDRPGMEDYLFGYFPAALNEKFQSRISGHPLAREITATVIANTLVDRAGSAYGNGMAQRHGVSLVEAIASWLTFDRVLEGETLRQQVHALDNRLPAETQHDLLLRLDDTLVDLCDWSLGQGSRATPEPETVARFKKSLQAFEKALGGILPEAQWNQGKLAASDWEARGLGAEAARRFAMLPYLNDFPAIMVLAEGAGCEIYAAARAFMEVRNLLGYDEILGLARRIPLRDRWDRQALQSLTATLSDIGFRLTGVVLEKYSGNPEACLSGRRRELTSYRRLRDALRGATPANFHPLLILVKAAAELIPRG